MPELRPIETPACYVSGCEKPVVAKIGLPSAHAAWACQEHFDEWEQLAKERALEAKA